MGVHESWRGPGFPIDGRWFGFVVSHPFARKKAKGRGTGRCCLDGQHPPAMEGIMESVSEAVTLVASFAGR
jgi:hypothetical protein